MTQTKKQYSVSKQHCGIFTRHEVFPLNVVADVASVKRGLVCFYIRPGRAIAEEDVFLFGFNVLQSQKTKFPAHLLKSLVVDVHQHVNL